MSHTRGQRQHEIVVAFGAALLLVVVFSWRKHRLLLALAAVIGVGLVGNAAISGARSAPSDRYQSRVIWLVVFYALLGGWSLVTARGGAIVGRQTDRNRDRLTAA